MASLLRSHHHLGMFGGYGQIRVCQSLTSEGQTFSASQEAHVLHHVRDALFIWILPCCSHGELNGLVQNPPGGWKLLELQVSSFESFLMAPLYFRNIDEYYQAINRIIKLLYFTLLML